MVYTFELNEEETEFVETFAKEVGQSVSDLAKEFLLEDVTDSRQAAKAWAEYENDPNPVTYKLVPVVKETEQLVNAV